MTDFLLIGIDRKCAVCDRTLRKNEDYTRFSLTPESKAAMRKHAPELNPIEMDLALERFVLCESCKMLPENERRGKAAEMLRKMRGKMTEEFQTKTEVITAEVLGQIH
jgi:hypothetical protein